MIYGSSIEISEIRSIIFSSTNTSVGAFNLRTYQVRGCFSISQSIVQADKRINLMKIENYGEGPPIIPNTNTFYYEWKLFGK